MITQTCYSYYSNGSSESFQFYTFLFATATLLIVSLILHIIDKKNLQSQDVPKFNKRVLLYTFLAIVTLYFCNFFSKLSTEFLPQTVFYPLSYIIAMPLTFLVDVIVFKEKITPLNIIGLLLVITAGVLVNI
jgi:drug/metabolite transporter (DMT)-like permease